MVPDCTWCGRAALRVIRSNLGYGILLLYRKFSMHVCYNFSIEFLCKTEEKWMKLAVKAESIEEFLKAM